MKILEVELVNHIVIPQTFHIDLRNKSDVICIDGLNGSGKSFLINNIHPLSSNKRFKDRYPIIKGKPGMKRIVFDLGNGNDLEVIHEYVVNGKRHSCKSYCNLIEDGKITELNPTGHTGNFEDIVRKYLYFDNDTFVCSFLSPKADSIVNATSAKRKDILKNTMKSSKILEKVIDKNREILSEANSSVKVYNKQMEDAYRNLPYKSIEEFENSIKRLSLESSNLIDKKRINEEHKEDLLSQRAQYENMNSSDLEVLSKYLELLDVLELNSMKEAFEHLDSKNKNLGILEYQLNVNTKRLKDIMEKIDNYCDVGSLNAKIKEYEDEQEKHTSDVNRIVDNKDKLFILMNRLNVLKDVLDDVSNLEDPGLENERSIDKFISQVQENINENKKFIESYNEKLRSSSNKDEELNINRGDNCDSCDLFIKYVKNTEYIRRYADKFNSILSENDELNRELNSLNKLKELITKVSHITSSIMEDSKVRNIFHLDLTNYISIVKEAIYSQNAMNKISEYLDNIKFLMNRLNRLGMDLADLYKTISKSSNIDINEFIEEQEILESNSKIIRNNMKNDMAFVEIFNEYSIKRGSSYDALSKVELKYRHMELNNMSISIRKINTEISNLSSSIENIDKEIIQKSRQVTSLQENMRMLENLNSYLVEKKMESNKHAILKDILEKRIPLKLMETNMSFIENTVNSIMEENEINLSIDILIEENDVRIEVATRNQVVDDIAMCSSGELCLLGVVLNAVLMHIIGYTIISFDEMDSNLDVVYRESFHNVIYSILEKLNIEQVFCVSHNISFDMNVGHIVIGEYDTERLHGEIIEYN